MVVGNRYAAGISTVMTAVMASPLRARRTVARTVTRREDLSHV